jgi:hypothetical protein
MEAERPKRACGAQTELVKNDAARVTRCGCGTIHLHLQKSGVSLQLPEDTFLQVLAALNQAREGLRAFDGTVDLGGQTIN